MIDLRAKSRKLQREAKKLAESRGEWLIFFRDEAEYQAALERGELPEGIGKVVIGVDPEWL